MSSTDRSPDGRVAIEQGGHRRAFSALPERADLHGAYALMSQDLGGLRHHLTEGTARALRSPEVDCTVDTATTAAPERAREA